jgi:hypothetical protein
LYKSIYLIFFFLIEIESNKCEWKHCNKENKLSVVSRNKPLNGWTVFLICYLKLKLEAIWHKFMRMGLLLFLTMNRYLFGPYHCTLDVIYIAYIMFQLLFQKKNLYLATLVRLVVKAMVEDLRSTPNVFCFIT